MTRDQDALTRLPVIEPMPADLLREPLNWIFAEHHRQRQLCDALQALSRVSAFHPPLIASVLDYLETDLKMHHIDEEEDLFPLLRRRCLPEDEIEQVLGALSADHVREQENATQIRDGLQKALDASVPPAGDISFGRALRAYAQDLRQHLAIENAVVLPIARIRLGETDLEGLSQRMAARRGVKLSASQRSVPQDNWP